MVQNMVQVVYREVSRKSIQSVKLFWWWWWWRWWWW